MWFVFLSLYQMLSTEKKWFKLETEEDNVKKEN